MKKMTFLNIFSKFWLNFQQDSQFDQSEDAPKFCTGSDFAFERYRANVQLTEYNE